MSNDTADIALKAAGVCPAVKTVEVVKAVDAADAHAMARRSRGADCATCPLRRSAVFSPVTSAQLALIDALKRAEWDSEAGSLLITEGQTDAPLYTLLAGWAMRFKTLSDGRRQIVQVLLPGDFIGLQQKMDAAASHGVQALTGIRVCSFTRDALWRLHRVAPELGYYITRLAAHGQRLLDDNLLSVGRRHATERVAAVLLSLWHRAAPFQPGAETEGLVFPLTHQHLADALGLSLVHTHRSLRLLRQRGLLRWLPERRLLLPDPVALSALAQLPWPLDAGTRPLI